MRKRFVGVVFALLLASLLALGGPGASAQVAPLTQSENVEFITNFPETALISGEFAHTGEFLFTSSLDSVSSFDVSDPEDPQILDTLPTVNFENESMTYGEQAGAAPGEVSQRFVVLAEDIYNVSPTHPEHIHVGGGVAHIVDVTDPANITLAGQVSTEFSTHTVQCVKATDCQYAYNAGTDGMFEILDFTDINNPTVLKKVKSPAAGTGGAFTSGGAGHYWDFDEEAEIGWHTGSGGAVAFDVSDPTNPVAIQATNAKGVQTPYNDFILHNSRRPNATKFQAGTAPDVNKGNVLLVTEEDYYNFGEEYVCEQTTGDEAGTFQTWYVPEMDLPESQVLAEPSNGTIRPLDIVNAPAEFGNNAPLSTPVGAFCSAHWFDYHQDGVVAQGYYQQGLWLEDVRDAENIKYYGYWTPTAAEVWDALWVPARDANGVVTGEKTDLVYSIDAVRGIDVLRVGLPSTGGGPAPDIDDQEPTEPPDPTEGPPNDPGDTGPTDEGVNDGGGARLPATGGGMGLLLLGAAALPLAAYIGRRRR